RCCRSYPQKWQGSQQNVLLCHSVFWDRQKHRAAEAAPLAGRRQPATVRTRGQVSAWLGRRPQPQQQRSPSGFRDSAGPRKLV
ncbi:mCG67650, partial [Mus musculus]